MDIKVAASAAFFIKWTYHVRVEILYSFWTWCITGQKITWIIA